MLTLIIIEARIIIFHIKSVNIIDGVSDRNMKMCESVVLSKFQLTSAAAYKRPEDEWFKASSLGTRGRPGLSCEGLGGSIE